MRVTALPTSARGGREICVFGQRLDYSGPHHFLGNAAAAGRAAARLVSAAPAAAMALVILGGCSVSGGQSPSGTSTHGPAAKRPSVAVVGKVRLSATAPDWCDYLVTAPVQRMAVAMPEVALGGRDSRAGDAVLEGARDLLDHAARMPDDIAPVVRQAAGTITAFVVSPQGQPQFHAAESALESLSGIADRKCGL